MFTQATLGFLDELRRVIEYFLSPLLQHDSESLRERLDAERERARKFKGMARHGAALP